MPELQKTIISSAFQQSVLDELADIKKDILRLGPCIRFSVNDQSTWDSGEHGDKLNELAEQAKGIAMKALPPVVFTALMDILLLENGYFLGIERKKE